MTKKASLRKIDNLGRIVIPMDLRRALEISDWDELRISLSGSRIIIEKEHPECTFCRETAGLVPFREKHICPACLAELQSKSKTEEKN